MIRLQRNFASGVNVKQINYLIIAQARANNKLSFEILNESRFSVPILTVSIQIAETVTGFWFIVLSEAVLLVK